MVACFASTFVADSSVPLALVTALVIGSYYSFIFALVRALVIGSYVVCEVGLISSFVLGHYSSMLHMLFILSNSNQNFLLVIYYQIFIFSFIYYFLGNG